VISNILKSDKPEKLVELQSLCARDDFSTRKMACLYITDTYKDGDNGKPLIGDGNKSKGPKYAGFVCENCDRFHLVVRKRSVYNSITGKNDKISFKVILEESNLNHQRYSVTRGEDGVDCLVLTDCGEMALMSTVSYNTLTFTLNITL
jgi:hypothetical protein